MQRLTEVTMLEILYEGARVICCFLRLQLRGVGAWSDYFRKSSNSIHNSSSISSTTQSPSGAGAGRFQSAMF